MGKVGAAERRGRWWAIAFAAVVVGPNLPTALLPTYRDQFGATSLGLSLLFSTYLFVLVPLLLAFGLRTLSVRTARPLALSALGAAGLADLALWWSPSMDLALLGRALSGLSVGLATVAVAVLAVAELGDRGRGLVATGSVVGSMVGVSVAVLCAALGVAEAVYPVHLVLVGLLTVVLVTRVPAPASAAATTTPPPAATPGATEGRPARRIRWSALLAGALCWSLPGVVIGLVPALIRDHHGAGAVLGSMVPVLVFLVGSTLIGVLGPRVGAVRAHPVAVGTWSGAVGALLLVLAAPTGNLLLAILGCAVGAAAPALAYRGGLEMFTRGAGAGAGRLTALYTGLSYGLGTVLVVGAGALGAVAGGTATAVTLAAGVLAVGGAVAGTGVVGLSVRAARSPLPVAV